MKDLVPDPQNYQVNSELSLFDKNNPDVNFMDLVDEENIRLAGSKLSYYKYNKTMEYDEVYMEQRNKPINTAPIEVYGHYDPKAIEENLTQFGIELTNDQVFTFNKSHIMRRLGRAPIPGDILQPHFQRLKYEVFEVQEDGFEAYGVYHYVCSAKLLRDAKDIHNTPMPQTSTPIGGVDERIPIV